MKILAITPYAGSKKLVKMTEEMLRKFQVCVADAPFPVEVVAVNNAAELPIGNGLTDWHAHNETNEGFGNAINLAIKRMVIEPKFLKITGHDGKTKPAGLKSDHTHVLLLNNDLEFPHVDWLTQLGKEVEGDLVLSPCTDITATKDAVSEGPREASPLRSPQISAFCWLVPVTTIEKIRRKFTFPLFHPEFSNYGSDDVTGAILRSLVSPKPFKVVPRSWVRHLKARTANELGVKAGEPELLRRIANFKRARRLS